eukprot:scaffold39837_cov59-Attheya_sp.AAC.2
MGVPCHEQEGRQQRQEASSNIASMGSCSNHQDRQSRQLQRIKCTKWRDVMHWVVLSSALLLGTNVYPSEAFATSFVPRTGTKTFVPRGGSSATNSASTAQRDTMECILQSHSPKSADATSSTSNQNEHKKQPPPATTPFVAPPPPNNDLDGFYDQDPTAPLRSSSPTKRNANDIFHHETDSTESSISASSSSSSATMRMS